MSRSLFRMLHRRFGTRLSGAERIRRAREHNERLRSVIPIGVLNANPLTGASPGSVAIVGAGFAGAAAAYIAKKLQFEVTVFDPAGEPGGRVSSSRKIVPGRILEAGAELIGLNHPVWLTWAQTFGFALGVVTPEDDYTGAFLDSPIMLNGVIFDHEAQERLHDGMQKVFTEWVDKSTVVNNPWAPWTTENAAHLDGRSLGENIPSDTPPEVVAAIETEFHLNATTDIFQQSWLANLAQFKAGGGQGYFDDTEIFRSTAGNQQLAIMLMDQIPLVNKAVSAIDTSSRVHLLFQDGSQSEPFDYVIVATSVGIWPSIKVDNHTFPYPGINHGPAIKYLAPMAQRFWIRDGLAPAGMSDEVGMTWEGTDNQAETAAFDMSLFAGGRAAQHAIDSGGTESYFAQRIGKLYPHFSTSGGTFVNWPHNPNIRTGYACPAPGQVVGAQKLYGTEKYNNRLLVAGEHTSPTWFGYMEGALQSGVVAALRMAHTANVDLPNEWGGTKAL